MPVREFFPNAGTATYETTLAGSITAAAGTVTITTPPGGFGTAPSQLPSDASTQWWGLLETEIVLFPGGTALTKAVTRAAGGGSPTTHPAGAGIRCVLTGQALDHLVGFYAAGALTVTGRDLDVLAGLSLTDPGTPSLAPTWGTAGDLAAAAAAANAGTRNTIPHTDHVHPLTYGAAADVVGFGSAAAAGTATTQPRTDHVHPAKLPWATADVTNPPAASELTAAFGTPSTLGSGFSGWVDKANAGTAVWLAGVSGTAWWTVAATKAT